MSLLIRSVALVLKKRELLITKVAIFALFCMVASACSFVEFEPSPYAPRSVEAIYSEQEDLTFLFWKLDESADLDLVSFEYFDPETKDWIALKLSTAIYPATPRACGTSWCFQYQLRGEVNWARSAESLEGLGRELNSEERAVRSFHQDGIYFGALDVRQRSVETTMGLDPIAIKRNVLFDPRRFDYFETVGLTLIRDYQWRLTPSNAMTRDEHTIERCGVSEEQWTALSDNVLPIGWTRSSHCMELRPVTRVLTPPSALAPMPPSAVLRSGDLAYLPPRQIPLTFFFTLNDLLVRSTRRCALLESELKTALRSKFKSETPSALRVDLGDFYPIAPVSGEEYRSCDQPFDRLYPATEMIDQIKSEILNRGMNDHAIFALYTNNSDDPLPDQTSRQLEQLINELSGLPETRLFLMIVAGQGLNDTPFSSLHLIESADFYLPWRARETTPFDEQMKAISKGIFPFHTVLFQPGTTPIQLPPPSRSDPLEFKVCALTPDNLLRVQIEGVGSLPGRRTGPQQSYPWGQISEPELIVDLLKQERVTDSELIEERVSVRYEVCEGFCEFPFMTPWGASYPKWSEVTICQREVE